MTSDKRVEGRYHGAVVGIGGAERVPEMAAWLVAETLQDYGHPVETVSEPTPREARIVTTRYAVDLTLSRSASAGEDSLRSLNLPGMAAHRNPAHPWRLKIALQPVDPSVDDPDISELLLVVMLYRICEKSEARLIEWLDPLTILSVAQFREAFTTISPDLAGEAAPRRTSRRASPKSVQAFQPLASPEEPQGVEAAQSDIRRLAAWAMTGVVATVSAPVAVSLAAVNLIKGEDFRLNTHVLAFTTCIATLHGSGALAGAMAHLPL